MKAEFMNDKGYITHYLKVDLTTRQYWTRSMYKEDTWRGLSMLDWLEGGIMKLTSVKTLLQSGFIKNDEGYGEGPYDLIHLSED